MSRFRRLIFGMVTIAFVLLVSTLPQTFGAVRAGVAMANLMVDPAHGARSRSDLGQGPRA